MVAALTPILLGAALTGGGGNQTTVTNTGTNTLTASPVNNVSIGGSVYSDPYTPATVSTTASASASQQPGSGGGIGYGAAAPLPAGQPQYAAPQSDIFTTLTDNPLLLVGAVAAIYFFMS